jgi:hypothetical protein
MNTPVVLFYYKNVFARYIFLKFAINYLNTENTEKCQFLAVVIHLVLYLSLQNAFFTASSLRSLYVKVDKKFFF